jgi:ribosomal protein S18 acetylase RimI-like enzyme
MVKSKELKLMRKKIEKAEKLRNPLTLITTTPSTYDLPFSINSTDLVDGENPEVKAFSLQSLHAKDLSQDILLLDKLLDVFEENMGDLYRASQWGLNMKEKREEFIHRKARYLLIWSNTVENVTTNCVESPDKSLAGFVHYRFDFDDDERPEFAVLYVYEIQVVNGYQRKGLGGALMQLLEDMGRQAEMSKVMLTVLHKNVEARDFYKQKCGYVLDESDPSNFNDPADYSILSKSLG